MFSAASQDGPHRGLTLNCASYSEEWGHRAGANLSADGFQTRAGQPRL